MKHFRFCFLPALFCVCALSCFSPRPSDETLLLYARSQNVYREGRFAEAAMMLAGETKFVPALVLRGKAEYLSGDLAGAEKSLKKAYVLEPSNTEAALFLARLHREIGDSTEARLLVENIFAANPQDIRALRFAADLAREKGASGEAASVALLDRAVEASAESALVFLDRARLRWIGGKRTEALEDLQRAKVLISRDSPVFGAIDRLESIISEVSR
jgi:tetratricopeptide (TPR) repeat protein